MLKRETFKRSLTAMKKQYEIINEINDLYKQISDGAFFLCFDGLVLPELEKVLREAMDDIGGTINWWLYESGDKKTVTWEKNGISHSADLTDIDALYDYLVEAATERHQEQQYDQQLPGQISL